MTSKNTNIVDRVVERIKMQPLGDLITEEDLYDIVKEALPKAFFEKRAVTTGSGYSERTTYEEPVIVTALRDAMKDFVQAQVKSWFVENGDSVMEYWGKVMDEGLVHYVQEIQREETNRHLVAALANVVNQINQERSRAGLPYINI
jgi:hypothetical protein